MAFIRTIPAADATGEVQEMYEQERASGHVPNYAMAFSLRPAVWNAYRQLLVAIRGNMDPRRYELVSVAAAMVLESSYCSLAHGQILRDKILGAEQTAAFARDFQQAELTPAEKVMVAYVQKIARRAREVTQADMDELRGHGFTDEEIFDIAAAASVRCFLAKLLDAVGTEPDAFYADMEPELRTSLTVGRDIEPRPAG